MLKRSVTYTDFNGDEVTEVLYFHLTKPELIEMEVESSGGLSTMLQRISENGDRKAIVAEFKKIVLTAYGEKSDDGKIFRKSDTIRENFASSAAYSQLFMELATDETSAAEFINGVMPKDLFVPDKPAEPPVKVVSDEA
ncbi:MAG: hypothetical protein E6R03_05960 [Hyphomicrobiaceae bacterium]|nr:MAG: hypothetical protein E6R03_05960 [Hyphomicrobiaceae bacterium]